MQCGEGCFNGFGVIVIWCIGYFVEVVVFEVYDVVFKCWLLEQLFIIFQYWWVEVKFKIVMQFKVVKVFLVKVIQFVIVIDVDCEGELIVCEIIDLCGYCGFIEWLWLLVFNDVFICVVFGKFWLLVEMLLMYYLVLVCFWVDWFVGMNFSCLFMVLGWQVGYDGVLLVGCVQIFMFKLVVDCDCEIIVFVFVLYWVIDVFLFVGGQIFVVQWVFLKVCIDDVGCCLQQFIVQYVVQQICVVDSVQVVVVEIECVWEGLLLLFDLGILQEVCFRQFGFDVQEILDIVQVLYEMYKVMMYLCFDLGYLFESMFVEVLMVFDSLVKIDFLL